MLIERLNWDSDFFNLSVGKCAYEYTDDLEAQLLDYDLIYCIVRPENEGANKKLMQSGAKLVDIKITFLKTVDSIKEINKNIYSYHRTGSDQDAAIVRIGMQSGIYSRFNIDENFSKADFEKLYTAWINNSIDRKIAKEVFVFTDNNEVKGMVTVGEKEGRADIGLIAVDNDARGKNIGTALINKVEEYCYINKIKEMQVVTQGANKAACNFYLKYGFQVASTFHIYHLWKQNIK